MPVCVAVAVAKGGLLARYLADPAVAALFLHAVGRHVVKTGRTVAALRGLPGRPPYACAVDSGGRPEAGTTVRTLHDLLTGLGGGCCANTASLFVRQPEATAAELQAQQSSGATMDSKDVPYALFCGGRDALGEWHVDPLGALVFEVLVGDAGDASAPPQLIVHELEADLPAPFKATPMCDQLALADLPAAAKDERAETELHKFKAFIGYYTTPKPAAAGAPPPTPAAEAVPPLHKPTVERALASARRGTNSPELLESLGKHVLKLTDPRASAPRGAMLCGWPGTAKTTVATHLHTQCGFVLVHPAGRVFAAGEVKGGFVGLTEKKVKALLLRPTAAPWLHWAVVLDEVETLLRDRNDTSGGGGDASSSSGLGVFLSYFEDHVLPNLFIFAATNLRNQVDEAAQRRFEASGMFFVGVPPPEARYEWYPRTKDGGYDTRLRIPHDVRAEMVRLTVNFSGSNMNTLMRELQAVVPDAASPQRPYVVRVEDVEAAVTRVAKETGRTKAMGRTVADLRQHAGASSASTAAARLQWARLRADLGCLPSVLEKLTTDKGGANPPTGLMLLDLSATHRAERERRFWSCEEQANEGRLDAPTLDVLRADGGLHTLRTQGFGPDYFKHYQLDRPRVYALLLDMAAELGLSAVQVVDQAFFEGRGDSQHGMLSALAEEQRQLAEYRRSMLVLDLDAALLDHSDQGTLGADSVQRAELLGGMFAVASRSAMVRGDTMRLVVMVSSHDAVVARAVSQLAWPLNHVRAARAAVDRAQDAVTKCSRCGEQFISSDNERQLDCRPHTSSTLVCTVNPKELAEAKETAPATVTVPESGGGAAVAMIAVAAHRRASYVWECCHQPFHVSKCSAAGTAARHTASTEATSAAENAAGLRGAKPRERHEHAMRAVADAPGPTTACWCSMCGRAAAHVSLRDAAEFPDRLCEARGCIHAGDGATGPEAPPRCTFHRRQAELADAVRRRRGGAGVVQPWFSYFGGCFQQIQDERVAAHLEAAVDWGAAPGEAEEDTRVPSNMELETCPRPKLRLHGRPIADEEALKPLLPGGVPCSAVRAWVACRCKKSAACACKPLTAGAGVVLRLSAVRQGAPPCCAGAACTVPSLQHRYDFQH